MSMTAAQIFEQLLGRADGLQVIGHDGSRGGDPDGRVLRLTSERALHYLLTSGSAELGFARAYLSGDLVLDGMDEGDPYPEIRMLRDGIGLTTPGARDLRGMLRALRDLRPLPPALPPEETPSRLRRLSYGLRLGRQRDAAAIAHHYDVSNRFYELLLGPSMTYTCAVYPHEDATLEEAQAEKYDLICRKLGLKSGQRLLDVGCGWGGMVRHAVEHYGVTALGVTLSREQATWGRQRIAELGLDDRAEIRHCDYRDVTERGFDAISSIGLTEHIGVAQYPAYFTVLRDRLRDEGRLLNHCITWPDNTHEPMSPTAFVERYVFPDGELAGSGTIVSAIEDVGLEVRHHENLRPHYARTCAAWSRNLSAHWPECVAETAGIGKARVWGLYLAGSRLNFERRGMELHQVLAVRTSDRESGLGLRRIPPARSRTLAERTRTGQDGDVEPGTGTGGPTRPTAYLEAVDQTRARFAELPTDRPVRLRKATSNLFRRREPATGPGLDLTSFTGVLERDDAAGTAFVGGLTTYEQLVDELLPHGWMPLVVPQLRTITIGGAVVGLGIESTSFRHGLPHESVLEVDVLTGQGEVVTASAAGEHADLLRALPNSYGTLGYCLGLVIELERTQPFVVLRHLRFTDLDSLAEVVDEVMADHGHEGEPVDFLDGVVFSATEGYLTLGRWSTTTEGMGRPSDYTGQQIYYRSLQHRRRDVLTAHDYLWRWDTDWFWCSRAFGAQDPRCAGCGPAAGAAATSTGG